MTISDLISARESSACEARAHDLGAAVAAQVHGDHALLLLERGELPAPVVRIAGPAVQQCSSAAVLACGRRAGPIRWKKRRRRWGLEVREAPPCRPTMRARRAQNCIKSEAGLRIMDAMAGLQYQAVHIRELLNASRTDVQRWLSTLPPFSTAPTQIRTARAFTISDLAFFSIVSLLHKRLDMPLRTVASFSGKLHMMLIAPMASNIVPARYFVNQNDDGDWHVGTEVSGVLSLAIDPVPIWRSVYEFVGLEPNPQAHLQFGLMALPSPSSVEPPNARRAG